MTQSAAILTRTGAVQVEVPDPQTDLMTGVRWGAIDAFPTPAYWTFQVMARRLAGAPAQYRLGRSLPEEVGACMLGGHGIPAAVGLAAYHRLRERGAFANRHLTEDQLAAWLKEPMQVGERVIHYRFASQKARYLAAALPLAWAAPEFSAGRELRDCLLAAPGVGLKTASWVARNWLDADDVAILDIHIMRVGQAIGLFSMKHTVERHYLELEERFLHFARLIDVRPSELDAVIWYEMASSPAAVRHLVQHLDFNAAKKRSARPRRDASQATLAL